MERATVSAARVGRGFGYGMIALGLIGAFSGAPGVLWLGLIGFFIILAGQAEEAGVRLKSTFEGLGLRRVMAVPAATLDAEINLADALRDGFAPLGYHAFPVVQRGVAVGLLTIDQVEAVPFERREQEHVGDLADRDPSVFVDERVTVEQLLANPAFQRHRRVVVRFGDGEIGILSATAIDRAVRARRMLDDRAPAPRRRGERVA